MKNKIIMILRALKGFSRDFRAEIPLRFKLWRFPDRRCRHCCLWCKHFDYCFYELEAKVVLEEFNRNLRR